jgi:mediator of RNA polymerase II transcription subunit 6
MFYDKQSNNQVLRMQTIYTGVPVKDEAAELRSVLDRAAFIQPLIAFRRFTGIEFALVHAQPPTFFIIQKRERLSPEEGLFSGQFTSRNLVISCSASSKAFGGLLHHE